MANKGQVEGCSEDLLHQSYVESVDRIVGTQDHSAFTFPTKIITGRVAFWDSFFTKYSSPAFDEVELDINTLEPSAKQSIFASLPAVQFWVNTGYLPSEKQMVRMNNVCLSASDISISETELNFVHDYAEEEKLDPLYGKLGCVDSYSSSSVDTARYILSNMNTTNKANTMAIMGGTRHSTILNSQPKQNVDMIQVLTHTECKKNNADIVVDNNWNNDEHCSPESFRIPKYVLRPKNTDVGKNNTSKWLISGINDDQNGDSHAESNSVNVQLLKHKENTMESNELYHSISKTGLRKKLYTKTDLPVDILNMTNSNKTLISKKKRNLHPALDFEYRLPRKYKIFKKHKKFPFRIFNKSLLSDSRISHLTPRMQKRKKKTKNLNSTCKTIIVQTEGDDNDCNDSSVMNNTLPNKHSIDCHRFHYMSSIESVGKFRQTKNKLSMSSECEENCNKKIYKNINNVRKIKSLNPIVCLKQLSPVEIQKYKTSRKVVANQKHEISNKINLENLNPVVSLRRLTKFNILKHKISDLRLHPVVRLKRLSELQIQKYIKDPNTSINIPRPRIRLQSLSNSDISKNNIICNNKTSTSSTPLTIRLQSNHSTRMHSTQILESKRKCNEKEEEFMNKLSNKVVDVTKNKYFVTRRSDTISPKYNKNSNISLKISKENENISQMKKFYIDSTSSSDITEITSISSHNSRNTNNDNKRSCNLHISDDDDEFVKFIHCPEKILELQRREYFKRLTKRFNGKGEKS